MALGPVLHVGGLGGPAAVEPARSRHSESSDIPKGGSHTIRNGLRSPRSRAIRLPAGGVPAQHPCGPRSHRSPGPRYWNLGNRGHFIFSRIHG